MISFRWVFLFAFAGWCGANAVAQSSVAPKTPQATNPASLDCTDEKNFSRCFKLVRTVHGRAFTANTYTGPDGETVYTAEVSYDSRERVVQAFVELEKSAAKVLESKKLVGTEEREEKLDVLRLEGEPVRGGTMVIQTSDENLLTVQSKSSKDVEIMANQMKQHTAKP
jgi:hypothetical protein